MFAVCQCCNFLPIYPSTSCRLQLQQHRLRFRRQRFLPLTHSDSFLVLRPVHRPQIVATQISTSGSTLIYLRDLAINEDTILPVFISKRPIRTCPRRLHPPALAPSLAITRFFFTHFKPLELNSCFMFNSTTSAIHALRRLICIRQRPCTRPLSHLYLHLH